MRMLRAIRSKYFLSISLSPLHVAVSHWLRLSNTVTWPSRSNLQPSRETRDSHSVYQALNHWQSSAGSGNTQDSMRWRQDLWSRWSPVRPRPVQLQNTYFAQSYDGSQCFSVLCPVCPVYISIVGSRVWQHTTYKTFIEAFFTDNTWEGEIYQQPILYLLHVSTLLTIYQSVDFLLFSFFTFKYQSFD